MSATRPSPCIATATFATNARGWFHACVFVASLSFTTLADVVECRADPRAKDGGATAVIREAPTDALDDAERLFERAEQAAQQRDYTRALDLMQKSYEACGRQPQLLFNIAELHRELGHACDAIAHFEQYLEQATTGAFRREAEQAIAALKNDCVRPGDGASPEVAGKPGPTTTAGTSEAAVPPAIAAVGAHAPVGPVGPAGGAATITPPATTADEAPRFWTPQRTIAISALGLGALAAGTSVFFAFSTQARDDDLDDLARSSREKPLAARPSWSSEPRSIAEDRDADRTRAIVFGAASGALIAAGVTLLLWPRESANERAHARVALELEPYRVYTRVLAARF